MKKLFLRLIGKREQNERQAYKRINSDQIESAKFDLSTKRMYIRFHNGHEYMFYRVSTYIYNAFLNAEMQDHYYEECIKFRFNSARIH
ncbi:MAG: KTSC domain-containing protein [Clostridia bacterium]